MKLTVKNLKGEKFGIEAELSQTVAQVKAVIETAKADLPAATMKLIHSGKVLKDADPLEKYNIKENDFLVVMVTKPKKPAAAPPAAAAPVAAPAAAAATATPAPVPMATESTTTTPAAASAPAAAPPAPARSDDFPPEIIANLKGMGFPEPEVRACLRAANGNPDVAVEFLTNGIPDVAAAAAAGAASPSSGGSAGSGGALQALRNHPQFNHLRRLVQSNPQMLQTVLAQIGQQQPELLNEINQNQAAFLAMMNEPIDESAPAPAQSGSSSAGAGSGAGAGAPGLGGPPGMMGDPAQMAAMMQNMSPQQLQAMAQMMGLTPEQVQAVGHMIGQMPPEQLQEYMTQAMGGGGAGGAGGGMGGTGRQVLQLSEEDMAAVNRLTDMGFDRTEAVQAYMACEKNEALAANLLMDSAGQEGGAFGFGGGAAGGSGGGGGGGSGGGGGNDDMDDMYD